MDWYSASVRDMLDFYPGRFAIFNAVVGVNAICSVILSTLTIYIIVSHRSRVMTSYRVVLLNIVVWCALFNIPGPIVFHPVMMLPTMVYGADKFAFEGMLLYNVHPRFPSRVTTTVMIVVICTSVFASFIATALSFVYYYQLLTGRPNSFFLSHKVRIY
ncbi:hypothetical protein Y032_0004g1723 [Ancylostoma ceylanicum]|uniref:Uncharacterized protein n=1 Tax=Ancylostoma ceylanicum TaxID=53326 RepID=A0A016VVC4_9BILA|nr:hypothetical protein Y032_0004g1723 [Ancylostoma ceylanicum]